MQKAAVFAGIVALCLGTGCHQRIALAKTDVSLTAEEIRLIERTEELGREIYVHDRYAAQATRLLFAHGVDLADAGTRGWITESLPNGCAVTFVTGDPEQWQSVCLVTFTEHEEPNIILVDKDLTDTQAAMFNARQLALGCVEEPCSDVYNTVVIPGRNEAGSGCPTHSSALGVPWLAYALAGTRDPNLIMAGGHYRATVSADGRTVLDRRSFSKSCLVLPRRLEDKPAVAYTLGHVLDNTPTEVHVFLSLLYGRPLYVVTADCRLWDVRNGKIRILKHP